MPITEKPDKKTPTVGKLAVPRAGIVSTVRLAMRAMYVGA